LIKLFHNQTNEKDFETNLPKYFNIEYYLRQLVIEILVGNNDGYALNHNNYFIFKNSDTGLLEYFPYDHAWTLIGAPIIGKYSKKIKNK
jgi:spore coat protein CotH